MKEEIKSNRFINKLLLNMEIDEVEYSMLCDSLTRLACEWRGKKLIDKEIVSYLYAIPLMVRNQFLSLKEKGINDDMCDRLEDIWVELDDLVSQCFYN